MAAAAAAGAMSEARLAAATLLARLAREGAPVDRKSTCLNSSHG